MEILNMSCTKLKGWHVLRIKMNHTLLINAIAFVSLEQRYVKAFILNFSVKKLPVYK